MNAIETASTIATEFAQQLNATPVEAQNWHALKRNDDIPHGDYRALCDEFGEVTAEMERAYKAAFNATFKPIARPE